MHEVKEIKTGIIRTEDDITMLGFLDWKRMVHGPGRDMKNLTRWLKRNMRYTIIETRLNDAPERDDFPEWHHVGHHVPTGQAYWNWFHKQFWWVPEKELVFSDSPDFWGHLTFPAEQGKPEHYTRFWGDIGQVAIMAFVESFLQMRPGDLWITLYDDYKQLILEAQSDFFEASHVALDCSASIPLDKKKVVAAYAQTSLWGDL